MVYIAALFKQTDSNQISVLQDRSSPYLRNFRGIIPMLSFICIGCIFFGSTKLD